MASEAPCHPPSSAAEHDTAAAEKLILELDPYDGRPLFSDSANADRYLRAVDEIQRSKSPDSVNATQIAMAKLEDEFRSILVSRFHKLEIDSLVDLSSLSMSSDRSADFSDDETSIWRGNSSSIRTSTSYRSIREVDLLLPDAINDLRSIADRMIGAGFGRECVQVYGSVRKASIDLNLRHLGVEKLSISDVQKLQWDVLVNKIRP